MSFTKIMCSFECSVSFCSDDKVGEDHLATAFDVTCRAWIVRRTNLDKIYTYADTHCRIATRSHTPTVGAHIQVRRLANASDASLRETHPRIRSSSPQRWAPPVRTRATTTLSFRCTTTESRCTPGNVDNRNPNGDNLGRRVKRPKRQGPVTSLLGARVTIRCRFCIRCRSIMRRWVGVLRALRGSWTGAHRVGRSVLLYVICFHSRFWAIYALSCL